MRRPTADPYVWHRAALAGHCPQVHTDVPQCGWYRKTLVRGGPWVPCRIWLRQEIDETTGELTEPELMLCEVREREVGAIHEWTWLAGNPISEDEWIAMWAAIEDAGRNSPNSPLLTPRKPLDLTARAPLPTGG